MTIQTGKTWTYRLGASFYVLWGLLHLIAAWRGYQLGVEQEPSLV